MNDKVFVSIVNYNGFNKTINCLKSILNLKYNNLKIIIIDNSSTDNSYNKIKSWFKKNDMSFGNKPNKNNLITLLKTNYNGGYAYGNNIAIRLALNYSDDPYIWILNNDTIVDKQSLISLINFYNDNKKQILGSKILYSDSSIIDSFGGKITKLFFSALNNKTISDNYDYIPGTSIFFKKNIIDTIGYIPENYFMYYEDVDWSTKALKNKIELKIVNESIVKHFKSSNISFYLRFYSFKNRLLFIFKNYPLFFPLQLFLLPIYILKKIIFK